MDLTWADGENCRTTCGGLDMANLETEFRTLVSVQDARAADAVEGHLAWGRLVDSDYVLVHGPPDWLGRDVDPEVLIARVASGRADEVERIRIARIQLHGVLHDPASEMTGIRLDHPSGCPALGPPDGAGSERRLATGAGHPNAVGLEADLGKPARHRLTGDVGLVRCGRCAGRERGAERQDDGEGGRLAFHELALGLQASLEGRVSPKKCPDGTGVAPISPAAR